MAKGDDYINIGMGLDIADLKAGLQDAKSQLKLAESEFKKNTSALDDWGNSAEGALEQVLLLTEKISYQEKQMALTRAEIERAKAQYGEASSKVKDLTAKLNDQQAYLNKLESQLGTARSKLTDFSSGESLAGRSAEELASSVSNLKTRLADQEAVLGSLRLKLDGVVQEYGEGSAQAQALNEEIGIQSQKLRDIADTLDAYEQALDDMGDEAGEAARGLDDMGDEMDEASSKSKGLSGGLDGLKDKMMDLAKKGIMKVVDALKDFIKQTIQLGIDFSSTMSSVQAITGASADEMAVLEKAAREAGATTAFSAKEAGEALKYMALAGWDSGQSVSALGGILDLAAASGMGLAEASDAVTDYLTAFGLEAAESSRLADLLAYAQANANTSVEQLVAAYKNSAVTLASSGQSVEQVTAALAAMSNAGLKGGEAGTALNAVMRDMTRRMAAGSIQVGDASVAILDAGGNFRSLGDILHDIGAATESMSEGQKATALQMTFTTEAIKGLNAMLVNGADQVNGFASSLTGSSGAAKQMAEIMNDNLGGDIKKLNSTLDEIKLALFDLIEGPLRAIVQALNEILKHSGDVGDGVAKNFQPVIDKFSAASKGVDALKNADWGGIAAKASATWDGIKSAFSGSSGWFSDLGASWKSKVTGAWDGVEKAFSKVLGNVKDAFTGSTSWFGELRDNWKGKVTSGWDSIKTSFQGVFNTVKSAFSGSTSWFGELRDNWKGMLTKGWDSIKTSFQGVFGTVKSAFSGSTSWFGELRDNWKGSLTKSWDSVKTSFESVLSKVKGAFSGSTSWFGELRDNWKGGLTKGWDSVKSSFEGVFGKVKSAFSGSTAWFGELRDNWKGSLTKSWDSIKTSFESVFSKVKSAFSGSTAWFGELRDNWKGMLTKGWDSIKTSFQGVFGTVKSAFSGSTAWFGELRDNWKGSLTKGWDTLKKFFEGVYDTIVKVFKPIVDFFSLLFGGKTDGKGADEKTAGAVGAIKAPFSVLSNYFTSVVTSIAKPFTDMDKFFGNTFSWAVKAIKDSFSGVVKWFTDNILNPLTKGVEEAIGQAANLGGGLVQGVADSKRDIVSGTTTIGEVITNALCDALGIHSPSRVMRDKVGLMIGLGIVEGMEDSRREALREAAVWSKSLSEGLSLTVDASAVNLDMGAARPAQTTVVTYNQTINSPEPLSAGEIYRDTRSLIGRRTWA